MKILITGVSSGIGYDLARVLAYRGHEVYVGCHRNSQVIRSRESAMLHFIKLDLLEDADFSILEKISFDCIVNQAGICKGGALLEDIAELEECFQVNVFRTFRFIQKYVEGCKNEKRQGKVLITSSLAGNFPIPYLGKYTSSKSALSLLAKTLHSEMRLEKAGIQVRLILPGAYHTGFNQIMLGEIPERNIRKIFERAFSWIEKKSNRTIVNKMITAIESTSSTFVFSAPFPQKIFTKIYRMFSL